MFTDTFYNSIGTGVTNCKTFTGNTIDKRIATGCTIQSNVTDDDIFFWFVCSFFRNPDDQLTTGKSFSEVIVTVTGQIQCKTFRNKCTKALSTCSMAVDHYCVIRQPCSGLSGDLRTKDRTESTVCIGNIHT